MTRPEWVDGELYPFRSHVLDLPVGRMHYIDEGDGPPVVMVHGNDTWSFLYRHLIRGLAGSHRGVAPDHIGFGLSDKPPDWSYLPRDHAANVAALMDTLDLHDVTLVVQDWGGPIGLSWAIDHPDRVKALVVMNTWMWSVAGDWHFTWFSRFLGGWLGRWLIRRFHFFARMMRQACGDKSTWTPAIRIHYLSPQPTPADRKGVWVFPREILGSSEWLDGLWATREALAGKPALLVWGMRDPAFRRQELERWETLFPDATTVEVPDVGHFVQEEMGESLVPLIAEFLAGCS